MNPGPTESARHYPATFTQQRLWFLDQLRPGDVSYLIPWALRITGTLDPAAFERSLNEVVRRHEVLRTTFSLIDGELAQIVADPVAVPLPSTDLSGYPDPEAEARRLATQEAQMPLDLAKGPLVRGRLLRLGAQDHVLLLTLHHIIFDGWSRSIFIRELASLYEAFGAGLPSPLPEPQLQYADYAVWQRRFMEGKKFAKQLEYWKQQLANAPAALELPTDRPRPMVQTFRGTAKAIAFPPALSERLREFSRARRASVFMTLLAGFQALLARHSGQDDIVAGTLVANRNRSEWEGLIGFFANTLALRLDLSGDPTFDDLVVQARNRALDAYSHQDVPFERIVQEISPERSLSHNPIFQVLFSLQNQSGMTFRLAGLEVKDFGSAGNTSKFELSVFLNETPTEIAGRVEYNTDLFDPATIERMMAHYGVLLEAGLANPGLRLSELPLLGEGERQQILVDWNATAAAYPRELCLHQVFEQQAERTPDAVACIFGGARLSYRELNQKANRIAHYLQRRGVEPDSLVGLCVERSPEMIAALLGILKAGAAYVPVDPGYPADRKSFILEDAGAPILLTQKSLVEDLPRFGGETIYLTEDWAAIAEQPAVNPVSAATPENLAYVLYTSGSTGKPKGVQITHRNLVNFVFSMRNEPGIDASDTLLAVTTLSFDIAGLEIYLPLVTGARLVLATREQALDGNSMLALMERWSVTVLQATPVTWRILLESGWTGTPNLKALCGGEALPAELAAQIAPRCRELWNMYGPTETTIWSSVYRVKRTEQGVVPIGRPIANTTMYVLDTKGNPTPMGVPGELYIGGDGVGRGYFKRPELTQEKFIADPFVPGGRLYRTGDVVKYLPGGDILYQRRADYQVKVRGYRIELGEIESVLSQHPAVQSYVVVVREDTPGDQRLVGYFVAKAGHDPSAAEMKDFLRQSLPEYMVPGAFMKLDAMPLTPNGKINRNALPKPEYAAAARESMVAPRDPAEAAVLEVWERVLNLRPIGVTDNFFEIGGHSLLAVTLLAEIRKATGKEIPLPALFQDATVEFLAKFVRGESATHENEILAEVQAGGSRPTLFAVVEPGTNLLGYRALSKYMGPDQPAYTLRRGGEKLTSRPYTNEEYDALALEYMAAMRQKQPHGPYYIVGMCEGAIIAFSLARQVEAAGEKVAFLAIMDAWTRENTRSRFQMKINHLKRRFRQVRRQPLSRRWRALTTAVRNRFDWMLHGKPEALKIHEKVYWPDKNFVPPKVDARLTLVRAPQQFGVYHDDPELGWGSRTNSGVEVIVVKGEHFSLLREPTVREVAQVLRKAIDGVEAATQVEAASASR